MITIELTGRVNALASTESYCMGGQLCLLGRMRDFFQFMKYRSYHIGHFLMLHWSGAYHPFEEIALDPNCNNFQVE